MRSSLLFYTPGLLGRALLSSLKSTGCTKSSILVPAARCTSLGPSLPILRAVSNCAPSALPYSTKTDHQEHATPSGDKPEPATRPFSEIPMVKTFLGINFDVLRDPTRMADYMEEQVHKLGPIFRLTGAPGIPDMVCVVRPEDVETAFRVGDTHYPQRFPFYEWKQALKELNRPSGVFLQ